MSQAELYRRAKFEEVMGREPKSGNEVIIFFRVFKLWGHGRTDKNVRRSSK